MGEEPERKRSTVNEASSSTSVGSNYEVFLSFRGKDIRKGFTDHLYTSLVDSGIRTFRDNEGLHVGERIGPELFKAIEQSKISIPIFSKGYASSKWCLLELTQMIKCMKDMGQIILPIFYDVQPSDVRHQTGYFMEDFQKHSIDFDEKTIQEWKRALEEVSTLKGWEKDQIADGHEAELVKKVVSEVCMKLKNNNVNVTNYLVGMDHHIEEMIKLLDIDNSDMRIVGIRGMGGIGKTTIAKIIYNQFSEFFEHCSFLSDIREETIKHKDHLQKKLNEIKNRFFNKKLLIVLDDVDQQFQLDLIAENCSWFGLGSRIIVTTRNKDILTGNEIHWNYEPRELDFDQSLRLFSKHAFRSDYPPRDFCDLSRNVVSTGGGLPLFLEIVGSFLFGKSYAVWEDTCKKLTKIPNDKVREKLKISFEALDYSQKQIFLDIACHFIGEKKTFAFYMWHDCGFFPENGIEVLLRLSLVKIDDYNRIRMHDQLRDLGRDIVRQENLIDPGSRSRLWSHDEAMDTLSDCTGTKKVETLCIDCHSFLFKWTLRTAKSYPREAFKELSNLRYLRMDNADLDGDLEVPLSKLRWLSWGCFPSNIKLTNFCPKKLLILDLSESCISDDWEGWRQIKMATNLKVLILKSCNLTRNPEFSAFPNLERLNLSFCVHLVEISPSIVHLKRLSHLDVSGCFSLKKLPLEFGSMEVLTEVILDRTGIQEIPVSERFLKKLETLSAWGCGSLTQISSIGHLQSLSDLTFDLSSISELPNSIGLLVKLRRLSLSCCKQLMKLPDSIGLLVELQDLDVLLCSSLKELPETIGKLKNLRKLSIFASGIKKLPDTIGMLQKLEEFSPWDFSLLEGEVPSCIWNLSSLRILRLDGTKMCSIPTIICGFFNLTTLDLSRCSNVQFPANLNLPSSLMKLDIPFTATTLDSVVNLLNLKRLGFYYSTYTELVESPRDISKLSRLEVMTLYKLNNISSLPMNIGALSRLKELSISWCERLQFLPDLPSSLGSLSLYECGSMEKLSDISNLKKVKKLAIKWCKSLERLPDLSNCKMLLNLELINCGNINDIKGLEALTSLEKLEIDSCSCLIRLPDLSNLKCLGKLRIQHCERLEEIRGLQKLEALIDLDISSCKLITDQISGSEFLKYERIQRRMSLYGNYFKIY